jgi:hypothetical protein
MKTKNKQLLRIERLQFAVTSAAMREKMDAKTATHILRALHKLWKAAK